MNFKWDITYKCNLNCTHCINGNLLGKTQDEVTCDEVRIIVKKLKEAGATYVHLLGGEPTARQDILEIFQMFQNENLDMGFNTNGLKFTQDKFRECVIKNKNIKNIVFSLEGPTAEINDSIRGKKVFDITTKNLKEMVSLKTKWGRNDLKLTINTVVSEINLPYIKEMIRYCAYLGVDESVLLQFIPEGNGANLNATLSESEELQIIDEVASVYQELKGKINIVPRFVQPLAQKYAREVLHKEFPESNSMCGAGDNFFCINNRGVLFPCDRCRERIESLYPDQELKLTLNNFWDIVSLPAFGEIYEKAEDKDTYKDVSPCNKCEYLRKKCYPCPAQVEGEHKMRTCMKMMEEIEKNV